MRFCIYNQDFLVNFQQLHSWLKKFDKNIYYYTNLTHVWQQVTDDSVVNPINSPELTVPAYLKDKNVLVVILSHPRWLESIILPDSYTDLFIVESCASLITHQNGVYLKLNSFIDIPVNSIEYNLDGECIWLPSQTQESTEIEILLLDGVSSFKFCNSWPHPTQSVIEYSKSLINFIRNRYKFFQWLAAEDKDQVRVGADIPVAVGVEGIDLAHITDHEGRLLALDGTEDDDIVVNVNGQKEMLLV